MREIAEVFSLADYCRDRAICPDAGFSSPQRTDRPDRVQLRKTVSENTLTDLCGTVGDLFRQGWRIERWSETEEGFQATLKK